MSFVINEAKVEELLRLSENAYTVSVSTLESKIDNYFPTYEQSSGTIVTQETGYAVPVLVTPETKDLFVLARRRIEDSGVPLRSADELTEEMDTMRRGH